MRLVELAEEIVSVLSSDANASVRVVVEISADLLDGASDAVNRLLKKSHLASFWCRVLLHALILQLLYSIRSERLLMEQLAYNLLFRWFVGLNMDEPVWDPSTFSKNRGLDL